jgi:hypothetical protein
VSYPHAEREGGSLVVTWAGYDHLEQARALAGHFVTMKDDKGWSAERLLLAGIAQLVPWLLQWHNDFDAEMQLRWGEHYRDFVRDEAASLARRWQACAAGGGALPEQESKLVRPLPLDGRRRPSTMVRGGTAVPQEPGRAARLEN